MTKRLAIQLFGHLRTFEYTFDSFKKNVLEPNREAGYEVDIFIHTWDELDHSTVSYRNEGGEKLTDSHLTKDTISLIEQLYQPKKIAIEPQRECDELIITEKLGNFHRSIKGCLNMSYSLYRGSELRKVYEKEHNITYDWVIVTRPDILFKKTFDIKSLLFVYEKFGFYIPENVLFYASNPFRSDFGVLDPRIIAGSDLIHFATPVVVDKATSLYLDFKNNIDVNNFYCMEVWWMSYFKKIGLEPLMLNYLFKRDCLVLYQGMLPHLKEILRNKEYISVPSRNRKIFFCGIPILKISYKNKKTIYKLFGFLPIIKIKEK